MSEDLEHLTDEDYEAIGAIVEGSVDRQHGEALLDMIGGSEVRRQQQDRALLDALGKTQLGDPEPREPGDDAA